MKLNLKEDTREWRKAALMSVLGLAILSSVLRWRRILPANGWYALLAVFAAVALCAGLRPRWFRGYYRFSTRLGFRISQFIGRVVLVIFFLLILTPLGLALRLAGKDLLRLKHSSKTATYWHPAKDCGPLDRLF